MPYQIYKPESDYDTSRQSCRLDTQLLYITRSRYDKQWQSVMHSHPFTELFFVVNGSGKFLVENHSFSVKMDDLIFINPNVMHTEFNQGKAALEYIALGLDGILFEQESGAHGDYSVHSLSNHHDEILFYLTTILRELQQKQENYGKICHNMLESLILTLGRNTKSALSFATAGKISRECRFIEQYLDEHFQENITLDTLSRLTYMNKYYVVHAFKKYKGVSPINYLINRRLEEAKHLLKTTDYPASKIALASGFSSQSYFSQVFRKELNMTPGEYRKLNSTNKRRQ